jgi:hypothetical protein
MLISMCRLLSFIFIVIAPRPAKSCDAKNVNIYQETRTERNDSVFGVETIQFDKNPDRTPEDLSEGNLCIIYN